MPSPEDGFQEKLKATNWHTTFFSFVAQCDVTYSYSKLVKLQQQVNTT